MFDCAKFVFLKVIERVLPVFLSSRCYAPTLDTKELETTLVNGVLRGLETSKLIQAMLPTEKCCFWCVSSSGQDLLPSPRYKIPKLEPESMSQLDKRVFFHASFNF